MEQQKLTIRFAGEEDAAALAELYRPYVEKTAITFEYEAPDQAEFARRIAHTLQRYPYLIAELDGAVVGYAYVGPLHSRPAYDWSVETSIYVDQNKKHMGIGKKLHEALEEEEDTSEEELAEFALLSEKGGKKTKKNKHRTNKKEDEEVYYWNGNFW